MKIFAPHSRWWVGWREVRGWQECSCTCCSDIDLRENKPAEFMRGNKSMRFVQQIPVIHAVNAFSTVPLQRAVRCLRQTDHLL